MQILVKIYYSMQQKAFEIANRWINRNYRVYQSDHKLWQRYDVAKDYIRTVKGGDYDNQVNYVFHKQKIILIQR